MANDFLRQILGSAMGGGRQSQAGAGGSPLGDLLGGMLSGAGAPGSAPAGGGLGGMLGGGGANGASGAGGAGGLGGLGGLAGMAGMGGLGAMLGGRGRSRTGGRNAMLLLLLPLAMQWVQRNGGIGAVLERFKQKGQEPKVQSWVGTGDNEPVDPGTVREVVGSDELSRLSQQLDADEDEVADGLAEIFPEMVNQLSPSGEVQPDADQQLSSGAGTLQQWLGSLGQAQARQ
jgi:uncharacterized protein YidB (DUF937 family)